MPDNVATGEDADYDVAKMNPLVRRATKLLGMNRHWTPAQIAAIEEATLDESALILPQLAQIEQIPTSPIDVDGCVTTWNCDISKLSGRNRSWMMPQPYGGDLGILQPLLFANGKPMRCLVMQIKGGAGKTTHALSLAATAAVDGSPYVQTLLWECLRQPGLRPFFDPTSIDGALDPGRRHIETVRVPITISPPEERDLTNSIRMIFAPNRIKDSLNPIEAEQLYQVIKEQTHLLFIDSGQVDLLGAGSGAELLRGLLADEETYILIPWTPNLSAWSDAVLLLKELRDLGVAHHRCWGVTLTPPNPRLKLGIDFQEAREIFEGRVAQIPYRPLALEESMVEGTLPIFLSPELRLAYHALLERMLVDWLNGAGSPVGPNDTSADK